MPRATTCCQLLLAAALVRGQQQPPIPGAQQFQDGERLLAARESAPAVALLQEAAKQGHPAAQGRLGEMFHRGAGVEKDPALAADYFQSSVAQGYAFSLAWQGRIHRDLGGGGGGGGGHSSQTRGSGALDGTDLGNLFFDRGAKLFGEGLYPQAVAPLSQAALLGHPAAQGRLGEMFYWGAERYAGLEHDDSRAAAYLRSSADQGYAFGQTWLGRMYHDGIGGVPKSYSAAVELYRLAAAQGEMNALEKLGLMYDQGRGVDQDKRTAFPFYLAAAEQGDVHGQANTAIYHATGWGTGRVDDEQALYWMTMSANQGHAPAAQQLPRFLAACPGDCADRVAALVATYTRKTSCTSCGFTADKFCAGRGTPTEEADGVQRICVCQGCTAGFTGVNCEIPPMRPASPPRTSPPGNLPDRVAG